VCRDFIATPNSHPTHTPHVEQQPAERLDRTGWTPAARQDERCHGHLRCRKSVPNAQDDLPITRVGVVVAIDSDGTAPSTSIEPACQNSDPALDIVIDRATPVARTRRRLVGNRQCKADNPRRPAVRRAELGRTTSGGIGGDDRGGRRRLIGSGSVLERGVRRWPRPPAGGIRRRPRCGRWCRSWSHDFGCETLTDRQPLFVDAPLRISLGAQGDESKWLSAGRSERYRWPRDFSRPSSNTMSASPSPTAARIDLPSGDHDTRRAMKVARSPKSVTCRHVPVPVESAQMFVV